MKPGGDTSLNLCIDIQIDTLCIKVINLVYTYPDCHWHVPEHSHADFEFHIIPSGKGYINIEGHDLVVSGGEFYITGPFVQHRQQSDAENPMAEYCLECEMKIDEDLPGSNTSQVRDNMNMLKILSRPYPVIFRDNSGLSSSFETLFQEFREQQANYYLKMQAVILDLLIGIFRSVVNNENIKYSHDDHIRSVDDLRIGRLINYIELNYQREITLNDASNVLFLSTRQINRLMKKKYNITFHDYLLRHRISNALHLIRETNFTIEEIACRSGFSSHFYMYQVFRKNGLLPPAKHRQPMSTTNSSDKLVQD